jgi:hypothetical protein
MRRIPLVCLMLISGLSSISAQTNQTRPQLNLVSGDTLIGHLPTILESTIHIEVESVKHEYQFDQITELRFVTADERPPSRFEMRMVDGSTLDADSVSTIEDNANVGFHDHFALKFPSHSVHSVKIKAFVSDLDLSRQWNNIFDAETRVSDVIVVNRGGELESIEGVLGDLNDDKISFTIGDRSANIDLQKIVGMIFYRPRDQDWRDPVCAVSFQHGSQLKLKQVELTEFAMLGLTVTGQEIRVPIDELATLDFAMGRDVYLDDLTPTTNDWKPWIASQATINALRRLNLARVKQSFSGKPLSLMMVDPSSPFSAVVPRQFEHGFAIRGGGKLAFQFDDDYENLTGWIGFDPAANRNGSVQLTILLDQVVVWQQALRKKVMNQPLKLDLNVSGARRLVFQVDYADGRTVGDQLHLVDLKVVK